MVQGIGLPCLEQAMQRETGVEGLLLGTVTLFTGATCSDKGHAPPIKLLLLPEKVNKGGEKEAIMGVCNIP